MEEACTGKFPGVGFFNGKYHIKEAENCLGLKNDLGAVANGAGSALSINFLPQPASI